MATIVTDPSLLERLNNQASNPAGFTAPEQMEAPQGAPEPMPEEEGPSFMEDVGAGMGAGWERLKARGHGIAQSIAEAADDEEGSRYSNRRMRTSVEQARREERDLGTAGNIASMAVQAAPEIASMFVPGGMAVKAATQAGVGGLSEFGDIMARGYELGVDVDKGDAALAATTAGAIDATLGRFMPTGSKLPTRVASAVAQDATSGGQHQILQNLALGQDWNQDVGTAAAGSVVAGGVLRGGLAGFNKAMGFDFNKGGEKGSLEVGAVNQATGRQVDNQFMRDYIEHSNGSEGLMDLAMNTQDPTQRAAILDAKIATDSKYAETAGLMKAAALYKGTKAPITPAMFGKKMKDGTIFGEKVGYTPAEILNFKKDLIEATPSSRGDTKSQLRGETAASIAQETKDAGETILGNALGAYQQNVGFVDDLINTSDLRGWDASDVEKLHLLRDNLSSLEKMARDWSGNKKIANEDRYRAVASQAIRSAVELGVAKDLRGVENTPGTFNPLIDYHTMRGMDDLITSQYEAFHHGSPGMAAEKVKNFANPSDFAVGAVGFAGGGVPGAIAAVTAKKAASGVTNLVKGSMRRRAVRKGKEKAAGTIDQMINARELARQPSQFKPVPPTPDDLQPVTVEDGLQSGDLEASANTAEASLQSSGVNVEPTPQASVIDAPTQPQEVTVAADEASRAAKRAEVQEVLSRMRKAPKARSKEPVVEIAEPEVSPEPAKEEAPRVSSQEINQSARVINQRKRQAAAEKKAELAEKAFEEEANIVEVTKRYSSNSTDLQGAEKAVERLRVNAEKARERAAAEAEKTAETELLEAEKIAQKNKEEEAKKLEEDRLARTEKSIADLEALVKKPKPKGEEAKEESAPEPQPEPEPEPEKPRERLSPKTSEDVKPKKKVEEAPEPEPEAEPEIEPQKPREKLSPKPTSDVQPKPKQVVEEAPEPTPDDLGSQESLQSTFERSPEKIPMGIRKHLQEKSEGSKKTPTFEGFGMMSAAGKQAADRAKLVSSIATQTRTSAHTVDEVITSLGIKDYSNPSNGRLVKDALKSRATAKSQEGADVVSDIIQKGKEREAKLTERHKAAMENLREKNRKIKEGAKASKNREMTPEEKKAAVSLSKESVRGFASNIGANESDILNGYASLGLTEGVDLVDPTKVNKAIASAASKRKLAEARKANDTLKAESTKKASELAEGIKAAKEESIKVETQLNNAKTALNRAERKRSSDSVLNSLKKEISGLETSLSDLNTKAGNLEAERKRSQESLAQSKKELAETVDEARKAEEVNKSLTKLNQQQEELREDLLSRGVPEGYIEDEMFKSFGRASEPMSGSAYRSFRERAINKADAEAIRLLRQKESENFEDLEPSAANNLKELEAQKESVKEQMIKNGATTAFADAFVDRRFIFMDSPVSAKELNQIGNQAINASAKDYSDFISAREKMLQERDAESVSLVSDQDDVGVEVADAISNMDKEQAEGALNALINNFGDLIKGKSKEMAKLASILSALESHKKSAALNLESKDARVMKSLKSVLSETVKMKNKYPEKPWLWLTREQVDELGNAYRSNDRFGKEMGSLGPKLRLAIFGSTADQPLLSREARDEIIKTGVSYEKFLKPYDWFSKNQGEVTKKGDFYYRSRVRPDGTMTYIKVRAKKA